MTPLETKFAALLVDCEEIMEHYVVTAEKWKIISKKHQQTKTVIDEESSVGWSYGKSIEKIRKSKSYIAANEAFGQDEVFSKSPKVAGYWGTLDGVLPYALRSACKVTARRIIFNHVEALSTLRQIRDTLASGHIEYLASTKLLGVTTTLKRMDLPDEVEIIRLNTKELNEKQPLIQPYYPFGTHEISFADLELRVPITVPVAHAQEGAFFKAQNDAYQSAKNIFGNILDSILITVSGNAMLGPVNLEGGIEMGSVHTNSIPQGMPPPVNITIRINDLANISVAYDLVSDGENDDKTLSRAVHRFLLGRKRSDLVDKLVDYVISWEALLLTKESKPMNRELSYRFALNGASLLFASNDKLDRLESKKKMNAAYSARSTIVHGGREEEIDKKLKKGDFNDLKSLCDYLEIGFRTSLFWLTSQDVNERPYSKPNGWEELLWLR